MHSVSNGFNQNKRVNGNHVSKEYFGGWRVIEIVNTTMQALQRFDCSSD